MLKNSARASRLRRNTLNLVPVIAGVCGFVNPTAGRRDDVTRISRIEVDRKNVRVINDAVLDDPPRLSTVGGFVRQVPGARVNDICPTWIDGERFDVHQAWSSLRWQRRPRLARIERLINAIEGSGQEEIRILLRLCQRMERFVF